MKNSRKFMMLLDIKELNYLNLYHEIFYTFIFKKQKLNIFIIYNQFKTIF